MNDTASVVSRNRDFFRALRDEHHQAYPDDPEELARLLQNMNLATDDGVLNLAGVLLFAERPELIKPQSVVKAIRYPGNQIHVTDYVDTEDFAGLLPYHGLGSGTKRALAAWPQIDFADDRDGCLFTATVHRKPIK
jgi:hypothetical protein